MEDAALFTALGNTPLRMLKYNWDIISRTCCNSQHRSSGFLHMESQYSWSLVLYSGNQLRIQARPVEYL